MAVAPWSRTLAIVLIVLIGLLNFHIPHFTIEAQNNASADAPLLELVFALNVLAALVAAVGMYRNWRWGWIAGVFVVALSVGLYLAQETVGLPGLPRNWLEPSRIVALVIEAIFVFLAYRQLVTRNRIT